jgi:hypothetical protein
MVLRAAIAMRTLVFLGLLVPLVLLIACLSFALLVLVSPLMVYAKVRGLHLKDPLRASGRIDALQ